MFVILQLIDLRASCFVIIFSCCPLAGSTGSATKAQGRQKNLDKTGFFIIRQTPSYSTKVKKIKGGRKTVGYKLLEATSCF